MRLRSQNNPCSKLKSLYTIILRIYFFLQNSKRSRHSSLWSLTDDGGDEELNDMVNYGNDPFGHTNAEYSSQMMSSSNNARDASIVDQSNHHPRSSNVASASSFQNSTRHSASNEALN